MVGSERCKYLDEKISIFSNMIYHTILVKKCTRNRKKQEGNPGGGGGGEGGGKENKLQKTVH